MRNPFTLPSTQSDAQRVWESANANELWEWQYAGMDEFGNAYQRNIKTGKVVKIPKGVAQPKTDLDSDDIELQRALQRYKLERTLI